MNKLYYIAYGSNLNIEAMKSRCPDAKIFGTGYLDNYCLSFKGNNGYAYLTVDKEENSKVPVAVWKIEEKDIKALDFYEGYPDLYYKENMIIEVEKEDGKKESIEAFIYIMNQDITYAVPSKFYFADCLVGYEDFDFKKIYLLEAVQKSIDYQEEIGGI